MLGRLCEHQTMRKLVLGRRWGPTLSGPANAGSLMFAGVLLLSEPACVRQLLIGRSNTGTCDGACDRYMECRESGTSIDKQRCLRECPEALGDPESIRAFESLSCEDVSAFVDGPRARPRQ
jgi:hypothetical protein